MKNDDKVNAVNSDVTASPPLKMVARHFMLSLCQLTPLNLEDPLPVGALFRALALTVTVTPAASPPA